MKRIKLQTITILYQKGFTFIELLLYLAIVTIMMTALIPFAWNTIEAGVKNSTEQEVFSNARYISEQLNYQIRNASGINSVSATSISLATFNANTNPTVIDLSSGNIRMKQGTGAVINLNSANTTISSLTFTNYTSADNKTKNIQYVLTIAASFPSAGQRQEYNESVTIESSAELRSN